MGWDQFTAAALTAVTDYMAGSPDTPGANGLVLMAWGAHAQKMIAGLNTVSCSRVKVGQSQPRFGKLASCGHSSFSHSRDITFVKTRHLVLKSAHPSPLSARKYFGNDHFVKSNDWLRERYGPDGGIDWTSLGAA